MSDANAKGNSSFDSVNVKVATVCAVVGVIGLATYLLYFRGEAHSLSAFAFHSQEQKSFKLGIFSRQSAEGLPRCDAQAVCGRQIKKLDTKTKDFIHSSSNSA